MTEFRTKVANTAFLVLCLTTISCASTIYQIDYKERYSPGTLKTTACIDSVVDKTPDESHFMKRSPVNPSGRVVTGGRGRFLTDLRDVIYTDLRESHLFETVYRDHNEKADLKIDITVHNVEYHTSNGFLVPSVLTVLVWPLLGGPTSSRELAVDMEFNVKNADGAEVVSYRQRFDCSKVTGLYYGKSGCNISGLIKDEVQRFKTGIHRDSSVIYDNIVSSDQRAVVEHQLNRRVVAVIGTSGDGSLSEPVMDALTDSIQEAIVRSRRFTLVERRQVKEILVEQKFQLEDISADPAVNIGRLLGAHAIIFGRVVKAGSIYSVSLQRLNVETGAVEISESATCPADERELFRTVSKLAKELTYL